MLGSLFEMTAKMGAGGDAYLKEGALSKGVLIREL